MIQLSLRFSPRKGQQDLAWLADTTGDLNEIYDALLRLQLAADISDETTKSLTDDELKMAVDGRIVQLGSPLVQAGEGSLILHLAQYVDATVSVQVLVALGLILKKGPEVAAFPHKLRERWYSSAADAIRAKEAYQRLREKSDVSIIEPQPDQDDRPMTEPPPRASATSRPARAPNAPAASRPGSRERR